MVGSQPPTRDIDSATRSASSGRLRLQRRVTRESKAFLRVKPGLRVERVFTTSSTREGERFLWVMNLKVRLVL